MDEVEVWADSMCGMTYCVSTGDDKEQYVVLIGHCVLPDEHPGGHLSRNGDDWQPWHSTVDGIVVGVGS